MKFKFIERGTLFIALLLIMMSFSLFAELKIDFIAPTDSEGKSVDGGGEPVAVAVVNDIIQFKNSDQFHGRMLSVDKRGVVWSSDEALDNIIFKSGNIKNILLGNTQSYSKNVNTEILLTNGDRLAGALVKLDDKELVLDTGYAGVLHIDRFMIAGIYPGFAGGAQTYKGPNDINEWIIVNNGGNSNDKVTIKGGVMTLSGYYICVGRDMQLPDLSKVELDMESLGNCQFQIQIYGDKVKRNPRNGYVLYISSGYIYLQRYDDGSSDNMGNFRSKSLRGGKAKITILTDKKEKKITLMVNGKMAKQWSDTEWAGKGGYLSFINQSNNAINIKNIVVGKWNGKIPGAKSGDTGSDSDSIAFLNDDVVSGQLKSIVDDKVVFKTEYAEMNIPLKRVKEIITASDSRHRARRRAKDTRCYFKNGNLITVELKNIKSGTIEGSNENFGAVNMKLNAFSKLQFNIYDEEDDQ